MAEMPNLDADEELPPIPLQQYPDLDAYPQAMPTEGAPPVEARTVREEAEERAAKRLRVTLPARESSPTRDSASHSALFLFAEDVNEVMEAEAAKQYALKSDFYQAADVSFEDFLFGVERNLFDSQIHELQESAFAASNKQQFDAAKAAKKGRKEIRLSDLEARLQQELLERMAQTRQNGKVGWTRKHVSERVRRNSPELIVPTRCQGKQERRRSRCRLQSEVMLSGARVQRQSFGPIPP